MVKGKKILITKFPRHSHLTGAEKHTIILVEHLIERGFTFCLLSSCSVLLSEFKKKGWDNQRWWLGLAPVTTLTRLLFILLVPLNVISALIALVLYKVRFGLDKLYCLTLTEKLIMTPIARFLGYEVVWVEHFTLSQVVTNRFFCWFYVFLSKFVCILTVSNYVKKELQNLGVENVETIYHGIDYSQYKKQNDLFGAMAEQLVRDKKKFRVGFVGQLKIAKGLEFLIRAMALVKKEIPEADLVILGTGPEKAKMQWLAEVLGVSSFVKFVGYKDNFVDWVYDFDVFVLPSLNEALGISIIEALACRRPVVATNIGGIPEIIKDQVHGLLVEPKKYQEIAKAIINIYHNPDEAGMMAERGRQLVKEKFSLQEMLDKYYKALIV